MCMANNKYLLALEPGDAYLIRADVMMAFPLMIQDDELLLHTISIIIMF